MVLAYSKPTSRLFCLSLFYKQIEHYMAFQNIPNPLGGGYSGFLGDLTGEVRALQRTEIQQRLNEIQQQKQWDRDDQLRNEKFALEMMTTDVVNDLRVAHAEKAANDADEFVSYVTGLTEQTQKQGRGFTLKEKMEILNKQKTILANNASAKSFIDSLEEGQKLGMQILPKLTDPEMRKAYMAQQAELRQKIKSPEFSWGLGSVDVMAAYQPPDPTANVVMGQWTKQLTPLVKEATDVGVNGVERINRDKLVKTIAANMQSDQYGVEKVKQRYGFESDQDVYNLMADRLTSSIQQSGGRTTGSGSKDKSKFGGLVVEHQSKSLKGGEGDALVLTGKTPIIKTVVGESTEQQGMSANVTPIKIMNLDGELVLIADQNIKSDQVDKDVSAEEVRTLKQLHKRLGIKADYNFKQNGRYDITYPTDQKVTVEIPFDRVKEQLGKAYEKDPDYSRMLNQIGSTKGFIRRGASPFLETPIQQSSQGSGSDPLNLFE